MSGLATNAANSPEATYDAAEAWNMPGSSSAPAPTDSGAKGVETVRRAGVYSFWNFYTRFRRYASMLVLRDRAADDEDDDDDDDKGREGATSSK